MPSCRVRSRRDKEQEAEEEPVEQGFSLEGFFGMIETETLMKDNPRPL